MTTNVEKKKNQNYGKIVNGFQKKNGGSYAGGCTFGYGGINNRVLGQVSGATALEIICQICFTQGHRAKKCKSRNNSSFVPRSFGRGGFDVGLRIVWQRAFWFS